MCESHANIQFDNYGISELRRNGYSADQTTTAFSRQSLLARLIDNDIMNKESIRRDLNNCLELPLGNNNFIEARYRWREDLSFIMQYERSCNTRIKGVLKYK